MHCVSSKAFPASCFPVMLKIAPNLYLWSTGRAALRVQSRQPTTVAVASYKAGLALFVQQLINRSGGWDQQQKAFLGVSERDLQVGEQPLRVAPMLCHCLCNRK